MIDVLAAISLTALFAVSCGLLLTSAPVDARERSRIAGVTVGWFLLVAVLGGLGLFTTSGLGAPAIGTAVLVPVALLVFAARRSSTARRALFGVPLTLLVALNAGRLLGIFFLLLHDAGRLPPTFATTAGWGDIAVAILAIPLAAAIHYRVNGWLALTLAWNLIGFVDLLTAVALGVGSAPGSPVRFIFEHPNSNTVASLPWVLIPGVLVPLYLVSHLAIFARLAALWPASSASTASRLIRVYLGTQR
jgi:hypothetical protein